MWATLQKHDSQFRAKQYKAKFSEIILLPNQSYKNIDIKEDIERTTFNELEDEFATINMLTLDLISVISRQNQTNVELMVNFEPATLLLDDDGLD